MIKKRGRAPFDSIGSVVFIHTPHSYLSSISRYLDHPWSCVIYGCYLLLWKQKFDISCSVHFNDVISTLYFHLPPDTKSKALLNLILLSNHNTVSLYKCGKISLLANFIEGEHLICIDFTNNNNHKYLQLSFSINTLYVSYIFKYSDNENSTQ